MHKTAAAIAFSGRTMSPQCEAWHLGVERQRFADRNSDTAAEQR